MTVAGCSRAWKVEAARDGRLGAEARARLLRHLEHCPSCAREAHDLEALAERLRALPEPTIDEVSVRRLKRRVLHALDRHRSASTRQAGRWLGLALAGATCAGVLSVVAARSRGPHEPSEPLVEVVPDPGARWATHTDHDVKRIDLESGTLHIRIEHHGGDRLVVVGLPDGEINDIGTTFSVTVAFQRTRRVGVDQGRISLRLRDGVAAQLTAGETWEPTWEPNAGEEASSAAPAMKEVRPRAEAETPVTLAPTPRTKPPSLRSGTLQTKPTASASPEATNEEDQAYLEVLRLLRAGDVASARTAARDYMLAFPNGFRAPELRRLLAAPPPRGAL